MKCIFSFTGLLLTLPIHECKGILVKPFGYAARTQTRPKQPDFLLDAEITLPSTSIYPVPQVAEDVLATRCTHRFLPLEETGARVVD